MEELKGKEIKILLEETQINLFISDGGIGSSKSWTSYTFEGIFEKKRMVFPLEDEDFENLEKLIPNWERICLVDDKQIGIKVFPNDWILKEFNLL